ncbi:hypothetical protein VTH06DRAFT_6369 [Thermothelomyces fergusii]
MHKIRQISNTANASEPKRQIWQYRHKASGAMAEVTSPTRSYYPKTQRRDLALFPTKRQTPFRCSSIPVPEPSPLRGKNIATLPLDRGRN